jgi:hypothetical protein
MSHDALIVPNRPSRVQRRTALGAGLAALLVGWMLSPWTARAQGPARAPSGIVYTESNDPNGNAIFAFQQQPDGSLAPVPGSPFPTGGLGITPTFDLGPFDSDQNVIVSRDQRLLFAVNGGSDSIAVFRILANGALTPIAGSPFDSGGSNPVSVGLLGDLLCVVNKDQDPDHPGLFLPNYTVLHLTPHGKLKPIRDATVYVDAGSSPSQALTVPSKRLLFGADFMGGLVRSFFVPPHGRLIARDAQPLPAAEFGDSGAPPFPLGLAVHPRKPLLYVGFVTINRLGVYAYADDGSLRFLRTVLNSGHAICWVIANRRGTRLYTSNTGDPSISVYDLTHGAAEPIEIQKVILNGPGNSFQIGLDSSESYLYAIGQQAAMGQPVTANALHVLRVNSDGTVTEVPSSPTPLPVPNSVRPQGVAAL